MAGNTADAAGSQAAQSSDDVARRAAATRVLARSVLGHQLLGGYLVAAAAGLITIGVFARGLAGWATVAAMVTGWALLAAVRMANGAARKPLRKGWPMLAAVTGWGKPEVRGSKTSRQSEAYFRPLDGSAGFTYVLALLALAGVAGIVYTVSSVTAATATTSVSIGTCQTAVRGPDICTARWQADGRTYTGGITWASTSDQGTVMSGRYDPDNPGTVYGSSLSFSTATFLLALALFLACAPISALAYFKAIRVQRVRYLHALAGAGAATSARRSRTLFGGAPGAQ